jgi:hypothetical protein
MHKACVIILAEIKQKRIVMHIMGKEYLGTEINRQQVVRKQTGQFIPKDDSLAMAWISRRLGRG